MFKFGQRHGSLIVDANIWLLAITPGPYARAVGFAVILSIETIKESHGARAHERKRQRECEREPARERERACERERERERERTCERESLREREREPARERERARTKE